MKSQVVAGIKWRLTINFFELNEGIYDIWWDQAASGQTTGLFGSNGNAILTKGLPDPVGYESDILNILFHDETNALYHGEFAYPNNNTHFYIGSRESLSLNDTREPVVFNE